MTDKGKGKLYGIGAGPGDPQLLTLKAVSAIERCDVIAVPKTGSHERIAFTIVEEYVSGKELLECRFSMDKDMAKRMEARREAANRITGFLEEGKNVGFVTLGDPTTYSTYMYVHKIIADKGFDTEIIPGVTSFSAAAASLGVALCEGEEVLTIVPARGGDDIDEILDRPGNKVIMKSGAHLDQVLEKLKERGYGDRTRIACRATMDGERLYTGLSEYEGSPGSGYFTLAIVKEK